VVFTFTTQLTYKTAAVKTCIQRIEKPFLTGKRVKLSSRKKSSVWRQREYVKFHWEVCTPLVVDCFGL